MDFAIALRSARAKKLSGGMSCGFLFMAAAESVSIHKHWRLALMEVGGISGHSRGDHPPTEAAVDFEVRVGGEEEWIGQDFREADQTGIGNAHRDIGVFVQEIEDRD